MSWLTNDITGVEAYGRMVACRWGVGPPPTAFGSISLGMSRAANGFCCMMEQVAVRAQRRRCLSRPTYR